MTAGEPDEADDWHVQALARRRRRLAKGSPVVLTSAQRAPSRGRRGFPGGQTYFVTVRAYSTPEPAPDEPARGREIVQFTAVAAAGTKPPLRLQARYGADAARYLVELRHELHLAEDALDFLGQGAQAAQDRP